MAEILKDVRQKHAEKWDEVYYSSTRRGMFTSAGANLRAAIEAGIVTGLKVADVDDMDPREVKAISDEVAEVLYPFTQPLEKN